MFFIEERKADLNERQLEAVVTTEGPVLVLAGAGSGKTRVLTYRIAHLVVDHRVPLSSILAMTFSNKAAREMQSRVHQLLNMNQPLPWISTFHSVGARLLRRYGGQIGISSDFTIYDEGEQVQMVKDCISKLGISEKEFAADAVHTKIGQWKNEGKFPSDVEGQRMTTFEDVCVQVYGLYEKEMKRVQALDFDDLLLQTWSLFRSSSALKLMFHEQWKYLLVDEFQDTNELQYKLLQEFMNPSQNLCVVGDDDQSIYGWRGAKIDNILKFDKVFENAKVIKLEENYRSTGNILKAADAVISKNELRHEKHLWTSHGPGERIRYAALSDDRAESAFVVNEIKKYLRQGISAEEIAVLYRMNSLSRGFEEECLRLQVPYRIIGGFRFYERKEIKDILAYFRLLMNPSDVMSFRRSIGSPSRGIGKASLEKMEASAAAEGRPIASYVLEAQHLPVVGKGKDGLKNYKEILMSGFRMLKGNESFVDLAMEVLDRSGYVNSLRTEASPEANERIENIQELMSAVQEFEEGWVPKESDEASDTASLLQLKMRDFLERISLMADVDQLDSKRTGEALEPREQVTFMSIHAAKGLEFKVCFVAGLEEGVFPSGRSFDDYQRLEEERRLAYVAITRAKEKLILSRACRRRTFGSINISVESRFLRDIPKELFDVVADQSEQESYSYGDFQRPRGNFASSQGRGGFSQRKVQARPQAEEFEFDFDQRSGDFEYSRGDKVLHPSFGRGVVQSAELMGTDECLTILFESKGKKKVLAKFVKSAG